MNDTENILTAEGLKKSYGKGAGRVEVIRWLDIRIKRGEFLAVMGPSGCGKSTLLHMLGLMTPCDGGKIFFNSREINHSPVLRRKIRRDHLGFVFQRFNLLNVLSAFDNVAVSMKIRGCLNNKKIHTLFEALQISDLANRKPHQMSIGQQQRVAVARAIAHQPDIVLADEPTGSLDSENAQSLLKIFKKANREYNQTIVMITHDHSAAAAADRILGMKDGILTGQNN